MNHLELQILLVRRIFTIKWNTHRDRKPLERIFIRADTFKMYDFSKTSTKTHTEGHTTPRPNIFFVLFFTKQDKQ